LIGYTGPRGGIGDIGYTGPQGVTGPLGPPNGPQGPPGAPGGPTGDIGPTGPQGIDGGATNTGATGPVGPQGTKGPKYSANFIYDNSATSGSVASSSSPVNINENNIVMLGPNWDTSGSIFDANVPAPSTNGDYVTVDYATAYISGSNKSDWDSNVTFTVKTYAASSIPMYVGDSLLLVWNATSSNWSAKTLGIGGTGGYAWVP
jgi:hypothetical protein